MGCEWSQRGGSVGGVRPMSCTERPVEHLDDESLDGLDRREDIARFPYVEFTGRDSITCPTCQGSGRIPSDQVNELVALIPYSDQRLQPQRTKQYVGLSVIVCLFVCALVTFFMFPRPVLVEDGGIRSVIIHFDHNSSRVLINMTNALNFNNGNFFTVLVDSVSSQVLYMKTVIGTQQLDNIISVQPLSQRQMNFTVSVEISGSLSYVYAFCTMASVKVHNIVVFTQTSVKTSYMVRSAQNTLEAYRYIDCGANSRHHLIRVSERTETLGLEWCVFIREVGRYCEFVRLTDVTSLAWKRSWLATEFNV